MKHCLFLTVALILCVSVISDEVIDTNQQEQQQTCTLTLRDGLRKAFAEEGGSEIFPLANITGIAHMGESGQATIASSALGDYVESLSGVTDIFPSVEAIDISMQSAFDFKPVRGKSAVSLPKFGPEWRIDMSLTINSFPTLEYSNIMHITYRANLKGIGSRFPGVWLDRNRTALVFCTDIDNNRNHMNVFPAVTGQQYNIVLEQRLKRQDVFEYEVTINNNVLNSVENAKAITLEDAKLYVADPWYASADVMITDMKVQYKIKSPRVYEKSGPFTLQKGHQETTLTKFGPAFKIDLKFKLKNLPNEWASIFHITIGNNGGTKGDRYPALFVNKNSYFHFTTCIDDTDNYHNNYDRLSSTYQNQMYDVTIQQKLIDGKYLYQVIVDGQLFVSKENTKPLVVDEAKLYLSDPWYNAADVEFLYFRIEY